MAERSIRLVTASFPEDAGFDTAISRAMLIRGSAGELSETFRLNVPGRVVAFGKQDVIAAGYPEAVRRSRALGYECVERLAGGRAAVFHEGTLAFSWMIPDADPTRGLHARFEMLSELMVRAFGRLGIRSEVGEVAGEYCPGAYSVHVVSPRKRKVMGVGQRLAKHAAHIGGVIVVYGARPLRDAIDPVYDALDLEWTPETAGSLSDADPAVTLAAASDAIVAELADLATIEPATLERQTAELARRIAPEHLSPPSRP